MWSVAQCESIYSAGLMCRRHRSYHRVVLPGEHGQAVLVFAEELLDFRAHALGLALQRDDDDGMADELHQAQEALSVQANTRDEHSAENDGNSDLVWRSWCSTLPDLKLLVHQSCSRYAWESSTMRRRERLMFVSSSADGSVDTL